MKEQVIPESWNQSQNLYSHERIAIYFSAEFLIGRVVLDLLNNVGLLGVTTEIFKEEGIDIKCLESIEDPALGNGGLGRLAACFIESAATLGLPLFGVGLYYKYGLFKQKFDYNGYQQADPDIWDANVEPWFEPRYEEAKIIEFADTKVRAIPYEMPVVVYNSDKENFKAPVFRLPAIRSA
jgi:starch phosphorylase